MKNSGDSNTKTTRLYHTIQKRKLLVLVTLFIILVLVSILAVGIGSVYIPPGDVLAVFGHALFPDLIASPDGGMADLIVLNFRLPRILLAILAGVALATAGAVMQGLLRNPLVSPFTLGLSSAASFGAALIIVLGPAIFGSIFAGSILLAGVTFSVQSVLLILSAFLFGWLSVILVYLISRTKHTSQAIMILAGVVIGYLFQAGLLGLKYVSNDDALRDIVTWLMGGMWGATWQAIAILFPIVLICFFLVERRAWDLNTLSSGDDVAKNLGINVQRFRISGLLIVSFAASACLAFTGIIGFVGLMAPHICRMLIGNDYRYLLPASALLGALILLISDTVARVILAPIEIPVGIIMYILGGLFFLFLITPRAREVLCMNISVASVSQKYGNHAVLKDISFESISGEVLALLGPNGSGKSTLIKTIADILAPASGSITIDGVDVQKIDPIDRAKMIGYVPQYFHYTPFTTVLDTVLIGRRPYMSWSVSDEDLNVVDKAMSTMNITDLSDRFVNELSGGQRQRVFIARALAQDPNFFLFDEPTSSLDLRHQLETVSTMREIVRTDNSGMIIALHDLNLALRYTDKVMLLKDGEMYDYGTPSEVLTTESVRDVYGVHAEFVENAQGRFILSYAPS